MTAVLLMNIPLMVLAFGLMVGIPLWMVLRRPSWHGKPEQAAAVPAYIARQRREAAVPRQRAAQQRRRPVRTVSDW